MILIKKLYWLKVRLMLNWLKLLESWDRQLILNFFGFELENVDKGNSFNLLIIF